METEKRLIDADAFLSSMIKRFHCVPLIGRNDYDCDSLKQMLAEAPTVDAVEVVRCKDCKSWEQYNACNGTKPHRCMNHDAIFYKRTAPDDFCSYGERKGNGRTD